ncbi:antiviral reverse transcriptase Drt3a [Asticcacaulis sp. EMRT-3]|uniref:antiviral reverse transcriptase Drt3a n=1 Tax=Asticcacaulis sp. EMRT-3 TaxID=3040349 RepID=UPI0024AF3A48|nr:antiviral reverse transcriptase Drt3a [Asticcacaulis sp. EMRT-3]MDI7774963.1 RNA-directed DNA polymerase [Asticcacaulis sp. EMRT-3]
MYDFAFDKKSLHETILAKDFIDVPGLLDPLVLDATLLQAMAISRLGFPNLNLKNSVVRGKRLYQFANIHDELVIRKLGKNIRRLTRVKQSDRDTIIRSIKTLLEEGHAFRVYRLDVKSFYESISRDEIALAFQRDAGFPPASAVIWSSFSGQLGLQNITGMPRGLAISAVIAEYLMRDFDSRVRRMKGVYYYARYVDDIFILTTATEAQDTFHGSLKTHLPAGLSFNYVKTKVLTFDLPVVAAATPFAPEHTFDFLGYQFAVSPPTKKAAGGWARTVRLDISKAKVKKIKSRLVWSLRKHVEDGNFSDYIDRVKVLTGNYNIYDRHTGHRRNVGVYFNYSMIDHITSSSLPELDKFWQSLALSDAGNLPGAVPVTLSQDQKNSLLSRSFQKSFLSRKFYYFKPVRLAELTECWAYA